jgi:hypothetical protein
VLGYDSQPLVVRALGALGGICMSIGPLLDWRLSCGVAGCEATRGIESVTGWIAVLLGLATVAFGVAGRLAPLCILTGLAGGAIAGLELIDVLNYPVGADLLEQVKIGLVITLGGAAVAGAGGIAGLSVAAAVEATGPSTR